jgi:hypothetical protein
MNAKGDGLKAGILSLLSRLGLTAMFALKKVSKVIGWTEGYLFSY